MTDLVERLREADGNSQQRFWGSRIFGEAADELDRMRRELNRLEVSNQTVADELGNEIGRLQRELAEAEKKFETADKLRVFWNDKATALAEMSVDKARAWDALNATFERGRRKAFEEAAQIAGSKEKWVPFWKSEKVPPISSHDALKEYRLASSVSEAIADAIRRAALETGGREG